MSESHGNGALVAVGNALEQALVGGDPTALLGTLAHADVYVRTVQSGAGLALGTIERDGESFLVAFTSLARLAEFDPAGGDYTRLPGRALASVEPAGLRLVLNPGSELGAVLEADERAELDSAPAPPEPWLLVGEPAHEPKDLLAAIRALAAREPAIRAAYRGLLLRRGAAAAELVVALDLEPGADTAALVGAAADAAREAGVESLALLPLGDDELSRRLVERTRPFYERP